MDDKKAQQPHESLGEVGELGHVGELGSNAAGAERPAAPAAASGFKLVPAAFATTTVEAQLLQALVNAGFPADEAETLAQAAIAEIASRKGK